MLPNFLGGIFKSPKMLELLLIKLYPILKEGDKISIERKKEYVLVDINGEQKKILANGTIEEVKKEETK